MNELIQTILVAVVGGVITYLVSITMKKGGVFGSALVVFASGLAYKFWLADKAPNLIPTFAAVATTASYAGMVADKHVKKVWQMVIVGVIVGLVYYFAKPAFFLDCGPFKGVGGALGTMAAISCFVFIGGKFVLGKLGSKKAAK